MNLTCRSPFLPAGVLTNPRRRTRRAVSFRSDELLQREGRPGERTGRQRHQGQLVVISRDAVRPQPSAFKAAMHDGPLPVATDPYRNRLHEAPATAPAITNLEIDVQAPETPGAVVAVFRPGSRTGNHLITMAAKEGRTGSGGFFARINTSSRLFLPRWLLSKSQRASLS